MQRMCTSVPIYTHARIRIRKHAHTYDECVIIYLEEEEKLISVREICVTLSLYVV